MSVYRTAQCENCPHCISKREREDGALDRDSFRARLSKLDAERTQVEADRDAYEQASPLASASVRRAMLKQLRTIEAAWTRATGEQKRKLVNLLASAVGLAAGDAPRPLWRTATQLAEENQE